MRKIAVLTSGGDAPGMNAAIRAVVRAGLFNGFVVYGINDGYKGLYNNEFVKLSHRNVSNVLNRGGTFLGTSRFKEFKNKDYVKKASENLLKNKIEYLVVIGGEGSYQGAKALSDYGIKVLCIPGTIDNDINSSLLTIGFDTAINTVTEAIDKIKDSSNSHNRCSIIEVMGRHCGDIAYHSGVGVGAEAIITNLEDFSYDSICNIVNDSILQHKRNIIIVITENICNVVDLAHYVEDKTGVETRSQILGYIQRGGIPTALDRYIASGMGVYTIEMIKKDIYNITIGTTGTSFYHTNIDKALEMAKQHSNFIDIMIDALR